MIFRHRGLFAGCLFLLAAALGAQAALVYDVELESGQVATVLKPGDTVILDLFATVTGTDNTMPEGFQNGYGSIIGTTSGGLTGSLSSTLAAPFNASGARAGVAANLTGDTVLDLGSSQTSPNTDFLNARATTLQTAGTPTLAGDGTKFKLATITFTVDSLATLTGGSTVNIRFLLPNFSGTAAVSALWMQDGIYQTASAGSSNPLPTAGPGVTITVIPEPSTALLLLAALAAYPTRRRLRLR